MKFTLRDPRSVPHRSDSPIDFSRVIRILAGGQQVAMQCKGSWTLLSAPEYALAIYRSVHRDLSDVDKSVKLRERLKHIVIVFEQVEVGNIAF